MRKKVGGTVARQFDDRIISIVATFSTFHICYIHLAFKLPILKTPKDTL